MERYFIGCYNKSVILTYLGIVVAIIGIANASSNIAIICLMAAGLWDLFDGPVARRCKRTETEKHFGVQIDSLADIIISLILPISIVYSTCSNYGINSFWIILISIIYVLAGVTRLAWFNITANIDKRTTYYTGLPVTYITLILPIAYTVLGNDSVYLSEGLLVLLLIVAILFIANIKIKKPTGKWYIVFTILALILTLINI